MVARGLTMLFTIRELDIIGNIIFSLNPDKKEEAGESKEDKIKE